MKAVILAMFGIGLVEVIVILLVLAALLYFLFPRR